MAKPDVLHFENDQGGALCRFVPRASRTDFEHEVTCQACLAKLAGTKIDCPHCGTNHGRRWACDALLTAAARD